MCALRCGDWLGPSSVNVSNINDTHFTLLALADHGQHSVCGIFLGGHNDDKVQCALTHHCIEIISKQGEWYWMTRHKELAIREDNFSGSLSYPIVRQAKSFISQDSDWC